MTGAPRAIATLLVANRGEIAVRIMRTARRMGMRTVAVYADDDARALHVASADIAIRLPGDTPAETYLNIPAIIAAAKSGGADAIHPGYGFLSENAAFADACVAAGIVFVGPSPQAMRAIGDKGAARQIAVAAGVPVVPGYDGEQTLEAIAAGAAKIGYPVLLKPAAGGGGKGMRIVERAGDLGTARDAAKREAARAFGDDRLIVERYLPSARHVEVQILADHEGNVVHLLERDCSVQRRYQKLIEEAPAPQLPEATRAAIRDCAVRCMKTVNYTGAGTVEFLVAERQFFFMEVNARLQVEHPVTEAVTSLDLVEWQLRIAAGESLQFAQANVAADGHAIEARLLAEDPAQDFVPQAGLISRLRLPDGMPGVRIDTGVREGDRVPVRYDSLIAKIIAHDADRESAIARLRQALAATVVGGLTTNRAFLMAILSDPKFLAGGVDTGYLRDRREDLVAPPVPDATATALAAFAALRLEEARHATPDPADPYSPWMDGRGWRLAGRGTTNIRLERDDAVTVVAVKYTSGGYDLEFGDARVSVAGAMTKDGDITAAVRTATGEVTLQAAAFTDGGHLSLLVNGTEYSFRIDDQRMVTAVAGGGQGKRLASPMPGQVVAVMTSAGKTVVKGEPLVIVEAMKMEHTISAPRDGRVRKVNVAVGDRVAAGVELIAMDEP